MAYLINVAISFSAFIPLIAVLFIIYFAYPKLADLFREVVDVEGDYLETDRKAQKFIKVILISVIVGALMISAFSPTNTYKHDGGYNRVQDEQNIEMKRKAFEQSAPKEIIDRVDKPKHTDEERKERFDDMVDYKSRYDDSE